MVPAREGKRKGKWGSWLMYDDLMSAKNGKGKKRKSGGRPERGIRAIHSPLLPRGRGTFPEMAYTGMYFLFELASC